MLKLLFTERRVSRGVTHYGETKIVITCQSGGR